MMSTQSEERPLTPAKRGKWLVRLAALIIVALGAFLVWPSPIEPVVWEVPPTLPMEGSLAVNDGLIKARRVGEGKFTGPEDVDVDSEGRIYAGVDDGRIIRMDKDGSIAEWANTQGRPLGMDFDQEGNLIVCDPVKGLISIDPSGKVSNLVPTNGEIKLGFTDDCEIAEDGTIYFSDASEKFGVGSYMEDMLEGRPHGKLLAYEPAKKKTTILLDQLYFANGVAVGPGDEFVLVNETYRFRVMRYWLKGEKAGQGEVFIEHLPGYPDGISSSPRGTFWIAIFTVRNPTADRLAGMPWVRQQMVKLPPAILPKPVDYGLIIEVDASGKVIRSFHDATGQTIANVTSVHEKDGVLYLGNLLKDYVGVLNLEKP